MRETDPLKDKSWTIDLSILQEKVHLFNRLLLKAMQEVLFMAKQTLKTNKDHHSPPEGVVVAGGNDYPVTKLLEAVCSVITRYGNKKSVIPGLHSF